MKYKGKELKTGSEYYAAAMDLMKHDGDARCVRGATELFVAGAEMNDRFCIARLKEILTTPQYLSALDSFCTKELAESLARIFYLEREEAWARKVFARRGIFGVFFTKANQSYRGNGISEE